jgi:hypothetical protein
MVYNLVQVPVFWEGVNNPEYLRVLNDYLELTKKYQTIDKREFIGGMPVTMENDCFKQLLRTNSAGEFVYHTTLKVDGERYLLFLSSYGALYFIDRQLNFYVFMDPKKGRLPLIDPQVVKPFLFDGELVQFKSSKKYEFFLFDVLFYQGDSFVEQNYHVRLDLISQIYKNVLFGFFTPFGIDISIKKWFPITDITKTNDLYEYINLNTNKGRTEKLLADGLILQPFDTEYVVSGPWNKFNNVLFKWKPAEDQTMDFKIKIEGPNKWVLLTRSGYPFTMPVSGVPATYKPTQLNKETFVDGDVAEFLFNKQKETFKLVRARPNKNANSKDSILSVFNFINNPFTLDQLRPVIESMTTGKLSPQRLSGFSKSDLILCSIKSTGNIFFTKYETKNIRTFYERFIKNRAENELEIRLVKKGKKDSSVDKGIFMYLLEYLLRNGIPYTKSSTIDISTRGEDFINYRSSYSSVEDVISGKSLKNESKKSLMRPYISQENNQGLYNNILFKLALSEELPTTFVVRLVALVERKRVYSSVRMKDRTSFTVGAWNIDLTIVKSGFSIEEASGKSEVFEIECEYTGLVVPFEVFLKSFSDIYMMVLQNTGYC